MPNTLGNTQPDLFNTERDQQTILSKNKDKLNKWGDIEYLWIG